MKIEKTLWEVSYSVTFLNKGGDKYYNTGELSVLASSIDNALKIAYRVIEERNPHELIIKEIINQGVRLYFLEDE